MSAKNELKKLQDALRLIKDECAFHHGSCFGCPLALEAFKCGITGAVTSAAGDYKIKPEYWIIPDISLIKHKED